MTLIAGKGKMTACQHEREFLMLCDCDGGRRKTRDGMADGAVVGVRFKKYTSVSIFVAIRTPIMGHTKYVLERLPIRLPVA